MVSATISLFSTPSYFQELVTSTVFDGYTGIQKKARTRWILVVPTIRIPIPYLIMMEIFYNKVFVLLILTCVVLFFTYMLPFVLVLGIGD